MYDWLNLLSNQGRLTISQNSLQYYLFFLLPLDSFVKKTKKIPQNNRQCIYCWQNCNRSPSQRFKAKIRDLSPDQLLFVSDQGTCTKTNIYMGRFCLTQKWPNPGLFNSNFGRSLQLSGLVNRIQINPYLTVLTALVALVNL